MGIKKIHIIGSVGSGKTYLARFLSVQLSIDYYQLDNVVWRRTLGGDVRNPNIVRDSLLENIIQKDSWIIEGAHHKWVLKSFEAAELIIYISSPKWIRDIRGITRFVKQKLGIEKGNFKQTFNDLFKHFKWNREYDIDKKPEIFEMLAPHMDRVIVVRNNKEIIRDFEKWKNSLKGET